MWKLVTGNLLESEVDALVNSVNCVGIMGKGIALAFKAAYPANFRAYQVACRAGNVRPGQIFVFETGLLQGPKFILNFPTKRHWRDRSRIEDIKAGLEALIELVPSLQITSMAIPPLGCGLGGLLWQDVRPLITAACDRLSEVRVKIYEPLSAALGPAVSATPVNLTRARALLIRLIAVYKKLSYSLSLLEVQKLAYFLQEAGEPLRLKFEKAPYGPFAFNLNKVLEVLDERYIRGYATSNGKPDAEIELLPDALQAAEDYLSAVKHDHLDRVIQLIEGFEDPRGLELLASVHWVAHYNDPKARDEESAIRQIHDWNSKKKTKFPPNHIRVCWQHLRQLNWI